jgi:hypothetical protein
MSAFGSKAHGEPISPMLDALTGQNAFLFDRSDRSTELAVPRRALGRVLAFLGVRLAAALG